jgi:hypothetical protein
VAWIKNREVKQGLRRKMSELAAWDSFYVIVGSAAGGLIGLQFVVLTLIAQRPPLRAAEAGAAFATPTIVHFATVLLLSAALRAPWHAITSIAVVWGLVGLLGVVYAGVVARRLSRQTAYRPGLEDWAFHVALPLASYVTLAISALAAPFNTHDALFATGAAALLLLFIGIHNAWDAIVYHVFVNMQSSDE